MKNVKTFRQVMLLLVVACTAIGTKAQYSEYYYHCVGDTIEWRAPNGFYSWWEHEDFYNNRMRLLCGYWLEGPHDSAIVLQRYYTPTPLKIIGISVIGRIEGTSDTNLMYDTVYIYDADSSNFTLKSATRWSPLDPHRTLHIKCRYPDRYSPPDTCCIEAEGEIFYPVYEYYFDSAFYVTDSFYVGGGVHLKGLPPYQVALATYASFGGGQWGSRARACDERQQDNYYCVPTNVLHKRREYGTTYAPRGGWCSWYWVPGGHHAPAVNGGPDGRTALAAPLGIYPIIEVDTTVPPEGLCLPIENVQVPLSDSGCATVTWDYFPNFTQVSLRYGTINTPNNQLEEIDVTGQTFYRLCGLTAPVYKVQLKALCDKQDMGWTDPVTFYNTYQDTTQAIVSPASRLEAGTFLSPNPATGSVKVSSTFSLQSIDIYNAAGLLVLHLPTFGHDEEISLEGYPAGTYLVAIHTREGTTHKKLLVRKP